MAEKLHATKNDLPSKSRAQLGELLNERLASAIDLQYQAKQAHWNLKGPRFYALHQLFDEVAEMAEEAVDELAERAVQLGGTARGSVRLAGKARALAEYPLEAVSGDEHVGALSRALAAFGAQIRAGIELAASLGDADTPDLFTEISRNTDKHPWFVEAHAEGKA
ncbi:MAG: DNA starvation/stationary phase protection protein Dps [Planctomycetes bacterium]|nr:DNA starvation/stationary phase protection protein Dps [Planctomycetota bacterium]